MTPHIIDVVRAVVRIAEAAPGFVYEKPEDSASCVYTWEGKGHCLIGQALEVCGALLPEGNSRKIGYLFATGWIDTTPTLDVPFSGPLEDALEDAQRMQDRGVSWGIIAEGLRDVLGEEGLT